MPLPSAAKGVACQRRRVNSTMRCAVLKGRRVGVWVARGCYEKENLIMSYLHRVLGTGFSI